jgi:Asp-tRNA(Asn)/Glu-tRNA(Gln) amidotransferase A subunit family amidase
VNASLVAGPAAEGARTIVAAIAAGERSSAEVVRGCLDRIAAVEDDLHAWAFVDPELALAQAAVLDGLPPAERGPLHGVPVGIKDILDTADQPTCYGSPIYEGARPQQDAVAVSRLRAAGAVIVGKTVTTEFALFQPGVTRNPHDPSRTPGGSSSGSAAAVAAGCVPLAVGTQTAGSVVRPASFCGVVGVKPTIGVVPREGVKPCSHTLDTVGAFGRDVGDTALALGVMAGDVPRYRPEVPSDPPRLGFARTAEWAAIAPEVRATIDAGIERLARHTEVVELALPPSFAGLVDAQQAVMGVEAARLLGPELRAHPDQISERLRTYLAEGGRYADRYDDALALGDRCRAELDGAFAGLDAVLAPAVLDEAPPLATTGDPLLCRMWTLLGTPTVAVPGLLGGHGLPLGIQVVARLGEDATALGTAAWVQPRLHGSTG